MFLRKIVEHLRNQNWFAVALDFFIVVVGVFVGIQVDNWNQARIERHKEQEHLVLLDRDLKRDVEVLDELHAKIAPHAAGAQLILNSISGKTVPVIQLEKAFTELYLTYAYTPQQPTYLALRNGAQLDLIRDASLRSSLVDYYEVRQPGFQMEYMKGYTIAQSLLHEHFSKYVRVLPPERSGSLWPPPANRRWTVLLVPVERATDDIDFLNDLSELGARAGEILEIIEMIKSENEAIQRTIQRRIDAGN